MYRKSGYLSNVVHVFFSLLIILPLFLSGCGGGDDGGSPAGNPPVVTSEAEGLYTGTTSANSAVKDIILDDGTFYSFYSVDNNPDTIAGVIQGTSIANGGLLTSADAMDYNIHGLGVSPATVTANYTPKQSVNGTIFYNGGSPVNFATTYDADYEITPSLADMAGTFTGEVAFSSGVENATVSISQSGDFTGSGASGCTISGTVTPRSRGNVYDTSVTFGGPPCYFANQTLHGIGYYDLWATKLLAALPTADRTEGVMFVGSCGSVETHDFSSMGTYTTPYLELGNVTVTGAPGDLSLLAYNGLGVVGGGYAYSDTTVDHGESLTFNFTRPARMVSYLPGAIINGDGDNLLGEAYIEAFGINNTSLGTVDINGGTFPGIDVSQLFGGAAITSFTVTAYDDGFRPSTLKFTTCE